MKLLFLPLMLFMLLAMAPQQNACAAQGHAVASSKGTDRLSLAMDIAKELRCPMATNQNLFESETAIASELKAQIYLMLEQGQSREQILDFMTQRYGEQIRYQPKLTLGTVLLWGAPVLLFLGLILLVLRPNFTRLTRTQ